MLLKKLLNILRLTTLPKVSKDKILKETEGSDFSSIAANWSKSMKLYQALRKRCHPDLFDKEQQEEATRLFQMIESNKHNYDQLVLIKNEIQEVLGIEVPN